MGKWIEFVKEARGNDTPIFVVGNKSDLEADRNVNAEKAETEFKGQGISYYEVSAKSGRNINEVFKNLCSVVTGIPLSQMADPSRPEKKDNATTKPIVTPPPKPSPPQNAGTKLESPAAGRGPSRIDRKSVV